MIDRLLNFHFRQYYCLPAGKKLNFFSLLFFAPFQRLRLYLLPYPKLRSLFEPHYDALLLSAATRAPRQCHNCTEGRKYLEQETFLTEISRFAL